jgi:hypothetical protein
MIQDGRDYAAHLDDVNFDSVKDQIVDNAAAPPILALAENRRIH